MAIAFKGNTIAIFILCVITVLVVAFWSFDRIQTPDDVAVLPAEGTRFVNPNYRKKDYVAVLSDAVRHIKADTNLIHQRLEMDYEPWQDFYMMILNMPEHAWEIIRYKFAVKMLKSFLQEQPPNFTMLFTGSSVTAGHESFYARSFVGIIEERMTKTLRAAGINTVVRNMAQPAFGCQVNNYCFPSLGINPGDEIDFMAWENTFNCGGDNPPVLEYFSRVAAQHKAIAFYSTSGSASLSTCQPSPDPVPYISYDWTPEVAGLTHSYSPSMAKVSDYKTRLLNHFRSGPAGDRLVRLSQRPYKGTAPHGMSMFTRVRQHCNATQVLNPAYAPKTRTVGSVNTRSRRQLAADAASDIDPSSITMPLTSVKGNPNTKGTPNAKGKAAAASAAAATAAKPAPASTASSRKPSPDGNNNTTIPPRAVNTANCMTNDLWATMCHDQGGPKIATKEFMFKGNAPGVLQGRASYNPSAGMHILRAELFLYNYYHILLDAIFNLQKDLSLISANHHNDPLAMLRNQLEVYERKLSNLQRTLTTPLSEPKYCPAWECGNPTESTRCYTDFQPNYLTPPPKKSAFKAPAFDDHRFSNIFLGNVSRTGWERVERNVISARQFGNKDRQVYYSSTEFNSRLPIFLSLPRGKSTPLARNAKEAEAVANEKEGIVKLYPASDKMPLENAEFALELNVVSSEDEVAPFLRKYTGANAADRVYTSTKTVVPLVKNVHYTHQKGHVHFYGLPRGYHVLMVNTGSSLHALAQKLNAQYAKQYREQTEDIDSSKSSKAASTTNGAKKTPGAASKRQLQETEDARPVAKLLKPKATLASAVAAFGAATEENENAKEQKKTGPKVVDAESLAKMSIGQVIIF